LSLLSDRCLFEGCANRHHANGWCAQHSLQWRRTGKTWPIKARGPRGTVRFCSVPGCERKHHANGWCHKHERQPVPGMGDKCRKPCAVTGCPNLASARGFCWSHRSQFVRGRTPGPLFLTRRKPGSFDKGLARRQAQARRKASQVGGWVTDRDWGRLVHRYRGLCAYCQLRPWEHVDHVFPLVRGGRHFIGNVLPACQFCNLSKGSLFLVEWKNR
jgi:hypothetical protein